MEIKTQQITVLFLSMFIFTLGFGITVPVMPYFAKSMGGNVVDVGLLMAAFSAMELIFAPIWGRVSDVIGRKPVILIGLSGFTVAFTGAGMSSALWMLYASQIVAGALAAGIFPAAMGYIADSSGPDQRGSLMGLMGAASGLGIIFGPASASVFAIWGLRIPYFAAAVLGLVTTTVAFMWLKETRHIVPRREGARKPRGILQALRPGLLAFFLLMFLAMITMASLEATFGYFAMDRFGLSETPSAMPVLWTSVLLTGTNTLGIGFTFFGVSAVITQGLLVGKMIERFGEERMITIGLVFSALGTALILVSPELVSLVISASILAVGSGFMMPSINTAVSKRTDDDSQGVVMGLLGSFNSVGRTLGPVAGGLAYSVAIFLPYMCSAAVSILSAAAFELYTRNGKGTINIKLREAEI
jgi:DHA1 family multidrug resistance protein-like MFS transporter